MNVITSWFKARRQKRSHDIARGVLYAYIQGNHKWEDGVEEAMDTLKQEGI